MWVIVTGGEEKRREWLGTERWKRESREYKRVGENKKEGDIWKNEGIEKTKETQEKDWEKMKRSC